MHFPPYHRKKEFQRFLAGTALGAIIAYVILIYMYGTMYEQLIEENYELTARISELQNHNEALLEENDSLDEQSQESLIVNEIDITIHDDNNRLDRLITHQLEELIKEEVNHIIGSEIDSIGENGRLLTSTIENKAFVVDDFTYYFDVTMLTIGPTVEITLEIDEVE